MEGENPITVPQYLRYEYGVVFTSEWNGTSLQVQIHRGPTLLASFEDTPFGTYQTQLENRIREVYKWDLRTSAVVTRGVSYPELKRLARAKVPADFLTAEAEYAKAMQPDVSNPGTIADAITGEKEIETFVVHSEAELAYFRTRFPTGTGFRLKGVDYYSIKTIQVCPDVDVLAATIRGVVDAGKQEVEDLAAKPSAAAVQTQEKKEEEEVPSDSDTEPEHKDLCAAATRGAEIVAKWYPIDQNAPAFIKKVAEFWALFPPITSGEKKRIAALLPHASLPARDYLLDFAVQALQRGMLPPEHWAEFMAVNILTRKGDIKYNVVTKILTRN